MQRKNTNEEYYKAQQESRIKDHANERRIHPLLNLLYSFMGIQYERNDDKETQLHGFDLRLLFRNKWYKVDEKADTKRKLCLGAGNVLNLREPACTFCYECSPFLK